MARRALEEKKADKEDTIRSREDHDASHTVNDASSGDEAADGSQSGSVHEVDEEEDDSDSEDEDAENDEDEIVEESKMGDRQDLLAPDEPSTTTTESATKSSKSKAKGRPKLAARKTMVILCCSTRRQVMRLKRAIKRYFRRKFKVCYRFKKQFSEYDDTTQSKLVYNFQNWCETNRGRRPSSDEAEDFLVDICRDNVRNRNAKLYRQACEEASALGLPPPPKRGRGRPRKYPSTNTKGSKSQPQKVIKSPSLVKKKVSSAPSNLDQAGSHNSIFVHLPYTLEKAVECTPAIYQNVKAWHQFCRRHDELWRDESVNGCVLAYLNEQEYTDTLASENPGTPVMTEDELADMVKRSKGKHIYLIIVTEDELAAWREARQNDLIESAQSPELHDNDVDGVTLTSKRKVNDEMAVDVVFDQPPRKKEKGNKGKKSEPAGAAPTPHPSLSPPPQISVDNTQTRNLKKLLVEKNAETDRLQKMIQELSDREGKALAAEQAARAREASAYAKVISARQQVLLEKEAAEEAKRLAAVEKEKAQEERLARERLEQQRLMQEKVEREKLEQQRLEQEKVERAERQLMEQEKAERKRRKHEKLQQQQMIADQVNGEQGHYPMAHAQQKSSAASSVLLSAGYAFPSSFDRMLDTTLFRMQDTLQRAGINQEPASNQEADRRSRSRLPTIPRIPTPPPIHFPVNQKKSSPLQFTVNQNRSSPLQFTANQKKSSPPQLHPHKGPAPQPGAQVPRPGPVRPNMATPLVQPQQPFLNASVPGPVTGTYGQQPKGTIGISRELKALGIDIGDALNLEQAVPPSNGPAVRRTSSRLSSMASQSQGDTASQQSVPAVKKKKLTAAEQQQRDEQRKALMGKYASGGSRGGPISESITVAYPSGNATSKTNGVKTKTGNKRS
ncbi:hypothetical protein BJ508DRAFT_308106 [Ascobolus immersus RN42]|uniref:Uncharacterized protein n=1 Tax=Ascobolus immersus RN42 TaxID=1160509 RepID=A0A3N4I6K3_ASCIM|nr:hypothetical protein BJ508DRAFT_308106 [Ascobolus immersus RN42]